MLTSCQTCNITPPIDQSAVSVQRSLAELRKSPAMVLFSLICVVLQWLIVGRRRLSENLDRLHGSSAIISDFRPLILVKCCDHHSAVRRGDCQLYFNLLDNVGHRHRSCWNCFALKLFYSGGLAIARTSIVDNLWFCVIVLILTTRIFQSLRLANSALVVQSANLLWTYSLFSFSHWFPLL